MSTILYNYFNLKKKTKFRKLIAHATLLKKILEDVLQQNEKISQKRGRCDLNVSKQYSKPRQQYSKFRQNTKDFGQRDLKKVGLFRTTNILKYVWGEQYDNDE